MNSNVCATCIGRCDTSARPVDLLGPGAGPQSREVLARGANPVVRAASPCPRDITPRDGVVPLLSSPGVRREKRFEALGVGRHLTDDPPSAGQICDALFHVASHPQIRLRLNVIRDELRRVGGPGHAADAVEDAATGRW